MLGASHERERERERERESWFSPFVYYIVGFAALYSFIFYAAYPIISDSWLYSGYFTTYYPYSLKHGWHPGRNISEFMDIIFGQGLGAPLGVLLNNPILGMRLANALGCTLYLAAFWLVSLQFFAKKYQNIAIIFLVSLSFFLPMMAYTSHFLTLQVLGGYVLALLCILIIIRILRNDALPLAGKSSVYRWGVWLVLCYLGTQITDTGYFVAGGVFAILIVCLSTQKYFPQFFTNPLPKYSKEVLIASFMYLAYCMFALARNWFRGGRAHSAALTPISFDLSTLYARLTANIFMIDLSIVVALLLALWLGIQLLRKRLPLEGQITLAMLLSGFSVIIICCVLGTHFNQALWIIWLALLRFVFTRLENKCKITSVLMPTAALCLFVGSFVVTQPKLDPIRARYDFRNAEFFKVAEKEGLETVYLTDEELSYLNIGNSSGSLYPNPTHALTKIGILSKPMEIKPMSAKTNTP